MPILKRFFKKKPVSKYKAPSNLEQLKRVLKGKPAHPNDEIHFNRKK